MVKQFNNKRKFSLPKVLFTSIYGHDDILDYLSLFRTQDKMHGVHYYPSGALCWFECNQYGEPTGSVYYARKIPDLKMLDLPKRQRGFRKLLSQQNKKLSLIEKFTREKPDTEQLPVIKPRIKQK